MRKALIVIGTLVVILAAATGFMLIRASERDRQSAFLYVNSTLNGDPEFRYLYAVNGGESRFDNYIYQSLDGKVQCADDVIGACAEVGDTFFFHSYVSPEFSREIYDRRLEPTADKSVQLEILQQSPSRDQAMTRTSENGKTIRASLFWIENGELWEITSLNERHVIAFQRSQFFNMIKPQR